MKESKFASKWAMHDFEDSARSCGERIRQARKKAGLSIADFAKKLNRDYSFVVKYETDKRTPKDELLIEMGDILGISPLYLKYGQYYEESDDFGGIALHYYSQKKYSSKNKEENESNIKELKKNINYILSAKNEELDYIKIMRDISRFLVDTKFINSQEGKKLLSNATKKNKNITNRK